MLNHLTGKGQIMHIGVFGGCNVDIIVSCSSIIEKGTSNIGSIKTNPGGVGRNIAENIKRLGCTATFISSVGEDLMSSYIKQDLHDKEISAHLISHGKTGIYSAIIDNNGMLDTAFCDMSSLEEISFSHILDSGVDVTSFDGAIIDANFSRNTIESLAEYLKKHNIRYALETVSNEKCSRLKNVVKGAYLIKPNRFEAEMLTGIKCVSLKDARACSEKLHSMGALNIIISLGSQGFYFWSPDYEAHFPAEHNNIIDVTGAGDAIISGAFVSLLKNVSPQDACAVAAKCASLTCSSREPVSIEITPEIFNI